MNQQAITAEVPASKGIQFNLSALVIPLALVAGYLFWQFVSGNPANFEANTPACHSKEGN